jgi:hypothetical protein
MRATVFWNCTSQLLKISNHKIVKKYSKAFWNEVPMQKILLGRADFYIEIFSSRSLTINCALVVGAVAWGPYKLQVKILSNPTPLFSAASRAIVQTTWQSFHRSSPRWFWAFDLRVP